MLRHAATLRKQNSRQRDSNAHHCYLAAGHSLGWYSGLQVVTEWRVSLRDADWVTCVSLRRFMESPHQRAQPMQTTELKGVFYYGECTAACTALQGVTPLAKAARAVQFVLQTYSSLVEHAPLVEVSDARQSGPAHDAAAADNNGAACAAGLPRMLQLAVIRMVGRFVLPVSLYLIVVHRLLLPEV